MKLAFLQCQWITDLAVMCQANGRPKPAKKIYLAKSNDLNYFTALDILPPDRDVLSLWSSNISLSFSK